MRMKILSVLVLLLVGILAATAVSAVPGITQVKLNGNVVSDSTTNFVRGFDKGEKMDVNVQVVSSDNVGNVQIEAMIRGYDHSDLMDDITDVFDMKANVTYVKDLEIPLRVRMDQGAYKLRVLIVSQDGNTVEKDYELEVSAPRHDVAINDVIMSPSEQVSAGKAVVAKVRVKNYGAKEEDGVKVTVSIPSLGVSDSSYIDVLKADGQNDDSATSEELFLRIPQSTKSGVYTVNAVITYDDGDAEDSFTTSITVVGCDAAAETCGSVPAPSESDKTVIAVSTDSQPVTAGQAGAVYPVTITNTGSASKTYVLSATAPWADVRFSPGNVVVVKGGETRTVQVYVAARSDASAGEQVFVVSVQDAAGNTLKDIALKANVAAQQFSLGSAKRALEIALVVLVVLLVIVGLIAAFNKLRGGGNEEEGAQAYY